MTSFKKHMENMKEDLKEGMQKVGHSVKHTAMDLKDEAMGIMQNVEDKKDELMEEYKEEEYRRSMERQAREEKKDNSYK
ncbi:hypothetical protein [Intestinibacter sp.]|uniref:hypothetical protein n=1 Tax=Intestinibacter sp. TaxID=1965304 RepID=UPI003F152411